MKSLARKKLRAPGPVRPGARIGLLGGSFNPAHAGHVHASEVALTKLKLDYVWWLVSPQNPLKKKKDMAPLKRRLVSAKNLARDPRVRVTDIETKLGTRYTIDTLIALKRRFPQIHLVWLMGSDNLVQMPRWRRWQDIFAAVPIAVVPRPGSARAALAGKAARRFAAARVASGVPLPLRPPAWTMLKAPPCKASASALRAKPAWKL